MIFFLLVRAKTKIKKEKKEVHLLSGNKNDNSVTGGTADYIL